MFQLDPSVFGRINSKADYDRQRAMLMAKAKQRGQQSKLTDLLIQQTEQALNAPEVQEYDTQDILAAAIQAGGVENLPPEMYAQLKAADISQLTKQSVDPRGNIVTNRSYFDIMGASPSQVMNQKPSAMRQPSPAGNQQMPPQPTAMAGNQMPDTSGLSPYVAEDVIAEEITARSAQDRKSQQEIEERMRDAQQLLPIFDTMLEFNEQTLDMPYAEMVNPVARITNPDAANAMTKLNQLRLKIAAPLAKQLGVNPTDKDFENTLNQIFAGNADKRTRREQIQLLKAITEGDAQIDSIGGLQSALGSIGSVGTKQNDPLGLFE